MLFLLVIRVCAVCSKVNYTNAIQCYAYCVGEFCCVGYSVYIVCADCGVWAAGVVDVGVGVLGDGEEIVYCGYNRILSPTDWTVRTVSIDHNLPLPIFEKNIPSRSIRSLRSGTFKYQSLLRLNSSHNMVGLKRKFHKFQ